MISLEDRSRIERLEADIEFRERRIKRLQRLSKGADSDWWKALREDIESNLKGLRQQLEMLSTGAANPIQGQDDHRSLCRFLGGSILAFNGIIADVDKAQEKIDKFNDEIQEARKQVKQLREQAGLEKSGSRREASVI